MPSPIPLEAKKGISAFIVETKSPGFVVGKLEDKLWPARRIPPVLIFEDCRVPHENLLGTEGEGFSDRAGDFGWRSHRYRGSTARHRAGMSEESAAHARQRRQFGRAIAEFEAIQWMLADMATENYAARLLTYRAAWLAEQGRRFTKEAAMANLFASEAANRAAYKAIQIFGGYGYTKEFAVEPLLSGRADHNALRRDLRFNAWS